MTRGNRDFVRGEFINRVAGQLARHLGRAAPPEEARPVRDGAHRPYSVMLQVILVQYDRKKYEGAVERLLGFLSELEGIEYSVLVVDNHEPGDWAHAITSKLTHIGGDNSAWEFSGFDRGLAYLESTGGRAQVYAFVTDAYTAYGEAFLSLVDAALVRAVARERTVAGWVDSWPEETTLFGKRYQEWVRTSFVLVPAEVLPLVRPLAAPLDTSRIFSEDPAHPFARSAPLGQDLQRYVTEWLVGPKSEPRLTEGWHSQFVLDRGSLPFFRSKVSAILREHSLSIRLREAGVPFYDFRLFQRLGDSGGRREALDPKALEPFSWGKWNAPDDGSTFRPLRYHLDKIELSQSIVHGGVADFYVEGWTLWAPQPEVIRLRVGAARSIVGLCNLPREDVAKTFPGYAVGQPGFFIKGALADLPPGIHGISLDFGSGRSIDLGTLEVLPVFEFLPSRTAFPSAWPVRQSVPFTVEGELRSSLPSTHVEVRLDGAPLVASAFFGQPQRDAHGCYSHAVSVSGTAGPFDASAEHELTLAFSMPGNVEETWSVPFEVCAIDSPTTIRKLELGPFDPDSGLTPVALDVEVFDAQPGDRLILERQGIELCETEIRARAVLDGGSSPRALVTLERHLAGIPAGTAQFSLIRRRGPQRAVVWQGSYLVRYRRPDIHVEELTVTLIRPEEEPTYRIHVKGWVKNHFLVDCLLVEVGSSRAAVIGMYELRPDVAQAFGSPLVQRQGFDAMVDVAKIPPGEHVVHIVATQRAGESARVSHRAVFEELPARRLQVTSDDLERLLKGQSNHFYSAITLRGSVHMHMQEAVVSLLVDGKVADEQPLAGEGSHEFSLRAVPGQSGDHPVRFVVSSHGRLVFGTDTVQVSFRKISFASSLSKDLGLVLDRFDLRPKLLGHASDEELTQRLLERQPERVAEFAEMLSDVGTRLRGGRALGRPWEPTTIGERRRLKVLFATWEVPSRYHGGGVYLQNLLTHLGTLHDVTLVHTYGIDETGHVEVVRPYMKRIISVPRIFAPAQYRGAGRFPLHLYDVYIPELRRVIELEAASGAYDLVDYEYSAMGPYVVPGVPSTLTVHELGYTAILNSAFAEARPVEPAIADIDRLIRSFYYFTSELPSICSHLLTLTEEDAAAITAYSDAHVFTNPGGVDVDEWPVWGATEKRPGPVLAFVGNFQHPPNIHAVEYFAEEVMPLVLASHPTAEFLVYGSRMSAAVKRFDGKSGVRVVGFVDDLRQRLRAATAMVAPIFTGTGQRIKVLEALGAGALVIGTDLSVRGLDAVDGEHYYRANTPLEFARAILRAFEQPDEAAQVARGGQELVATEHSWEAAIRKREAIWFATLSDAHRSKERPKSRAGGEG